MQCGVYAILNVDNGMRYVGSSKNIEARGETHFSRLDQGRHHNYALQRAYDTCGDVWAFVVLEICRLSDLEHTEQKWLDRALRLGRAYNLQHKVDRSMLDDTD